MSSSTSLIIFIIAINILLYTCEIYSFNPFFFMCVGLTLQTGSMYMYVWCTPLTITQTNIVYII